VAFPRYRNAISLLKPSLFNLQPHLNLFFFNLRCACAAYLCYVLRIILNVRLDARFFQCFDTFQCFFSMYDILHKLQCFSRSIHDKIAMCCSRSQDLSMFSILFLSIFFSTFSKYDESLNVFINIVLLSIHCSQYWLFQCFFFLKVCSISSLSNIVVFECCKI